MYVCQLTSHITKVIKEDFTRVIICHLKKIYIKYHCRKIKLHRKLLTVITKILKFCKGNSSWNYPFWCTFGFEAKEWFLVIVFKTTKHLFKKS